MPKTQDNSLPGKFNPRNSGRNNANILRSNSSGANSVGRLYGGLKTVGKKKKKSSGKGQPIGSASETDPDDDDTGYDDDDDSNSLLFF